MKRYRVSSFDFDFRPLELTLEIQENWEENVKSLDRENREKLIQELVEEFGGQASDLKRTNFADLGPLPFSILAFHNRFIRQIRTAFVMGAYYPALTASCALGERILNHLLLLLREDYSRMPEYKRIRNKESFDNWSVPIDTLEAWGVLLPKVAESLRNLWKVRNQAIHFKPEIDKNDRPLALEAISLLNEIIGEQFSGFGPQPWFITGVPGECYIKKEAELQPFIKKVYIPNCILVGPLYTVNFIENHFVIYDNQKYDDKEITDDEFVELRKQVRGQPRL
jgi:hypothetical protein